MSDVENSRYRYIFYDGGIDNERIRLQEDSVKGLPSKTGNQICQQTDDAPDVCDVGTFVAAVGALFVCVYCSGLSELDSGKMLISEMAILTFTSVIYFILGKEMGKTRVRV